jgi:hypothetical protein
MGLRLGVSSFFADSCKKSNDENTFDNFKVIKNLPNPDPKNYKIIKSEFINGHLIVMINYPDCTNYEGNKLLLYKFCTLEELLKQKYIDPHFSDNEKFKHPFARFEPTDEGWHYATFIAKHMW